MIRFHSLQTKKAAEFDAVLPTLRATILSTAILEAGRRSLDEGRTINLVYGATPLDIKLE